MHLTEWLKTDDTSIIQNWFINFIQHSVNHTVPIIEIDLSAFFLQLEVRTFTIHTQSHHIVYLHFHWPNFYSNKLKSLKVDDGYWYKIASLRPPAADSLC